MKSLSLPSKVIQYGGDLFLSNEVIYTLLYEQTQAEYWFVSVDFVNMITRKLTGMSGNGNQLKGAYFITETMAFYISDTLYMPEVSY